jgi:hypothetical protein
MSKDFFKKRVHPTNRGPNQKTFFTFYFKNISNFENEKITENEFFLFFFLWLICGNSISTNQPPNFKLEKLEKLEDIGGS